MTPCEEVANSELFFQLGSRAARTEPFPSRAPRLRSTYLSHGSWVLGLSVFKEDTDVPGAPGSKTSCSAAPGIHHWGRQDVRFLLHEGKHQVFHQLQLQELGEASMGHGGKWRVDTRCLERFMNPCSRSLHPRLTVLKMLGLSGSPLSASLTSPSTTSPPYFLRSCLSHHSHLPGASRSSSQRRDFSLSPPPPLWHDGLRHFE